jgi:hypothetical protein
VRTRIAARDQEVEFLTFVGFVGPQGIAVEADGSLVVMDSLLAFRPRHNTDVRRWTILA